MARGELPLPPHFDLAKVGQIWKVSYQELAAEAERWAEEHGIPPAYKDSFRVCLVLIDVQNAFCIPGFELFVSGRSGTAAVDDNKRLCKFIYRNLRFITQICPTLDTHWPIQIFHPIFFVDDEGNHPDPFTLISTREIEEGHWRFNPAVGGSLGIDVEYGQKHLLHYARALEEGGRYTLTVWPYHALLGSVGHALVPSVEEAVFFHSVARSAQPDFQIKGDHPLTEHYSAFGPEVREDLNSREIARKNTPLIEKLLQFDAVVIAGQAKSHCVAWTVADLLDYISSRDPKLAERVYLLEDCTSPVVVPGVIDYTDEADEAFERFAEAGMHIVRSGEPITNWPGIELPLP